jgi:hypothetical protein
MLSMQRISRGVVGVQHLARLRGPPIAQCTARKLRRCQRKTPPLPVPPEELKPAALTQRSITGRGSAGHGRSDRLDRAGLQAYIIALDGDPLKDILAVQP